MKRANYTPGKWTQGNGTENNLKTDVYINDQCVDLEGSGRTGSESEANARLIASAPELLALLTKVRAWCSIADQDLIDALVAKATGGDHE